MGRSESDNGKSGLHLACRRMGVIPFGIIQKILKWNLVYLSNPRTAVLLDDAALHTSCQGQWGEISSNKEHITVSLPTAWSRFIQLMRAGSMYHISVIRWQSSATYSSETLLFCSSDSLYSLISNQLTLVTVLLSCLSPPPNRFKYSETICSEYPTVTALTF